MCKFDLCRLVDQIEAVGRILTDTGYRIFFSCFLEEAHETRCLLG